MLNSYIKDSLKKFSLLFRQPEMVFVIIWFLDHFILAYVPSVNSIWITTAAGLFHVWVTKFETFFIFFKLSILTSNNVIWVGLLAILFDEAEHVVKLSTTGYVPAFYEVINVFIKPKNFLLMDLYLIVFFLNGLFMVFHFFCNLHSLNNSSQQCLFLPLVVDLKILSHTSPLH